MKKVLSVLLALLFCISFVGCDGEKEEVAPTTTQIKNSTTTTTTTTTKTENANIATDLTVSGGVDETKVLLSTIEVSTTGLAVTTNQKTTTVKKQTTTKAENTDATIISQEPKLLLKFKNNRELLNFLSDNKTPKRILKAGGVDKKDWDYSALLNSLENSKMIFEEKVVFSIKSSLYNLKEIYFDCWKQNFAYVFEDSKNKQIPMRIYCYDKFENAKFEDINPLFSTTNGYNVYGLNDSSFLFYLDNYSVVVYSDDNLITKEFIESLTIEKVKIA